MSKSPSSKAAASPSLRTSSSRSALTRSTTSSIRAGWIRPSATSRSIACLAISRRNGSKQERMMAPGVSSMISSTPVACSSARILRPSRPMIRPFRSSLGRSTTETVVSMACSGALRWMAWVMICLAFSAAASRASASKRLTRFAASRRASCSMCLMTSSFAASAVSPETRCSACCCSRASSSQRCISSPIDRSRSAARCSRSRSVASICVASWVRSVSSDVFRASCCSMASSS